MKIEIVSDPVCPWCYIGKRRLEQALAQRPDIQFEIAYRPFQLNPDMPVEGVDRASYLEAKFGGPERAKTIYARVKAEGAKEGLSLNIEGIARQPNTLAAHTLLRWGIEAGVQFELKEALLRAYFTENRDIGDHAVLADIAGAVGMDAALVKQLLDEGRDRDIAEQEDAMARQMGVSGVPFFIFERKYGVSGAQPPEQLLQVIDKVAEELASGELAANDAD
ncbi:DsbA family oxidoreductase [Ferrovibrio sp.]|uniref:DsbA family oxidoreductase n=1 Tax=Ferrovibrio sp. TaxID=1917215 RepID=UPI0025BD5BA7|nr:DsbA family oxidoreductase [Ferrovibrio sp.]MBX3455961.1 DsbA family oxidoreductase [Ferrovibrio sp.]